MKKKVSNVMLVFICIAICLYTAASFLLQALTGYEISSQLTISFFSFFAVELASLASIKNSKTKYQNQEETIEEEIIED